MNFIRHIEKIKVAQRRNNIVEVRRDLDKDWVKRKITNHVNRFGDVLTEEMVREQIVENDVVASLFAKDPLRQNIVENEVARILSIDKLPASGKNCVRFTPLGELTNRTGSGTTKSADFIIDDVFYTQKYTNESGGAQDNQFNDVVDLLTKGSINHKVGALVDGRYWKNKRMELETYFKDNDNVVIVSMTDLEERGY